MPEKSGTGGWRKRIHSRPGVVKQNTEDPVLVEEDTESLRPPSERSSWRSTFHSRPGTPSGATTPTIFQFDTNDIRREITPEIPSPRTATRPKLARYLSGYLSIKDAAKEPDFAEPWSEMPPPYTEFVDPMVSLQSIFAHMTAIPARPIPLQYNSGLFRVFEDYRKIREAKERLENLLQETFEGYRAAERFYETAETEYQAEIRRLELLIARGTSGMAGLVRTRQDTVVKRTRTRRKAISYDHTPTSFAHVPMEQLDEQIRLRTQQTLLKRPVSPSGKMTILSRHLENAQNSKNFTIGTPPTQEKKVTLPRNIQSELNLARFGGLSMDNSVPRSVESGFSGYGDPLPDEVESPPVTVESAVDLEAFVALQELGVLVARKRGIDTNKFLTGLMQLYSMIPENSESGPGRELLCEETSASYLECAVNPGETPSTTEHFVRHIRSQPQLGSTQRRQRHFSFEPGDDQRAAAFEEKLDAYETEGSSNSYEPELSSDGQAISSLRNLPRNAGKQKPSKIPSPIQRPELESARREDSNSSSRTVFERPDTEDRRDSRSSVLTAFRQNSGGSLRRITQSRSSSVHTLRHGEGHPVGSTSRLGVRHAIAAMAPARAVDQVDNSQSKNSATQSSSIAPAVGSPARASHLSEKAQTENALPH